MPATSAEIKRTLQRDRILDEAALQFNQYGYQRTSVSSIAKQLGMRTSNIYYYFKTKDDLLFYSYVRTLESFGQNVLKIAATGVNAADKLSAIMEQTFAFWEGAFAGATHAHAVVLDIDELLDPKQRQTIADLIARPWQGIIEIINQGEAHSELRKIAPSAGAHIVFAIVEWAPHWFGIHRNQAVSQGEAREITAILKSGIAKRFEPKLITQIRNLESTSSIIERILREHNGTRTLDRLSHEAAQLFNRSGYDSTSIDEICDVIGLTKGAFYHHFKNKAELLHYLFKAAIAVQRYLYQEVTTQAQSGLDAIQRLIHVDSVIHGSSIATLPSLQLIAALPAHLAGEVEMEIRQLHERFTELVSLGIHDESILPIDSSTVTSIYFALREHVRVIPNESTEPSITPALGNFWDIFFHGLSKRHA